MARVNPYIEERTEKYYEKYEAYKDMLPIYVKPFLMDKKLSSEPSTVVGYAYDLVVFFSFLKDTNPTLNEIEIKDIPFEVIKNLTYMDINEYQDYLTYSTIHKMKENTSIKRKMTALRQFYKYLVKTSELKVNPTDAAASTGKIKEKAIQRLSQNEVAILLNGIDMFDYSPHANFYQERLRYRDKAIITLFLHTGIRVSELVSLNLDDFNFRENYFVLTRKGGKTTNIYFNDEVFNRLIDYIDYEREQILGHDNEEPAVFISMQKKRLAVRSVQAMLDKYVKKLLPERDISPHVLRKTFGSNLYEKTSDVKLVSDALGHKSSVTAEKHYIATDENHRKKVGTINLYGE